MHCLSLSPPTRIDLSYWHREFSEQYVKLGSIPIIRSFIIASLLSIFEAASFSSSSSSFSSSHPRIKRCLRIVESIRLWERPGHGAETRQVVKIFDLRLVDATSVQGLFVRKHVAQPRMSSMNSLDWFLKNNFHRVVISLSLSLSRSLSNDSAQIGGVSMC